MYNEFNTLIIWTQSRGRQLKLTFEKYNKAFNQKMIGWCYQIENIIDADLVVVVPGRWWICVCTEHSTRKDRTVEIIREFSSCDQHQNDSFLKENLKTQIQEILIRHTTRNGATFKLIFWDVLLSWVIILRVYSYIYLSFSFRIDGHWNRSVAVLAHNWRTIDARLTHI